MTPETLPRAIPEVGALLRGSDRGRGPFALAHPRPRIQRFAGQRPRIHTGDQPVRFTGSIDIERKRRYRFGDALP